MTSLATLSVDLSLGSIMGAFFYGGLWWTVRRVHIARAAFWFGGSFIVRTVPVLAGICFIARGAWYDTAACLLGFLAARIVVAHFARVRPALRASAAP